MNRLPKRNEVPEELTWRLTDIYADEAAFEADMAKAAGLADQTAAMEGKLAESGAALKEALDLYAACRETLYSLSSYANMKRDEDTASPEGQARYQKVVSLEVAASEKMAFLEPEILTISEETLSAFYEEEPGLAFYEVTIREILRQREHSLSPDMEKLLASAGEMAMAPYNAFSVLVDADLKFPKVDGPDGEFQLSNGRFVATQMSEDREFRRVSFEKFYDRYADFVNTWAALYDGQVRQQIFFARARKYPNTFAAAVDMSDVKVDVCDNLIESVHRNMSVMHRYVNLRKKLLGVDELHMYDVYVPIVSDYSAKMSYEEAKELVLEALKPLGEEYVGVVREAFENRWIDVVENEGKRGGAYSSGVYAVHPYMLLNWTDRVDDAFILIHEMGHSMHTWYSSKNQSFLNADYKIFVAEVASTTNEILLLEHMLRKAETKAEKAFLINHYLESFKGTLFRQTMFEEFERETNAMAEAGTPLTAETLCETYLALNKAYFGPDMISDDRIAYEWCRIPHFYYNFYVYQYATSFAASVAIAHRILEEGQPMVDRYLTFLKSGCTRDPVTLLRLAGVDMSTGKPVDDAMAVFDQAIERMEELYGL